MPTSIKYRDYDSEFNADGQPELLDNTDYLSCVCQ